MKNALLKVAPSAGMSPEHAGVPQAHSLQQAPQGRALRGLGTAEALFRRGSRGLQIAAIEFITREEGMRHA